jgi:Family of unknown function (DUF5899)
MEIAVPLVALSSLYLISNQNTSPKPAPMQKRMEGFQTYTTPEGKNLPNTNVPDKNYSENLRNVGLDRTAELSVINSYTPGVTPTDKYFIQGENGYVPADNTVAQNRSRVYRSLTGDEVTIDGFAHNNMTPYFGGKIRGATADANVHEGILDAYSGAGSQIITKTEQSPLFSPNENTQYAYGAPINTDFIQNRFSNVASQSMNGVRPFEQQQVGPGLGLDPNDPANGGFNSGMQARDYWRDKTVDELRVKSNPKASEYGLLGYEGAPMHYNPSNISTAGIGAFEKNRPDRHFEMSQDRYFRTTGVAQSAPINDQLAIAAEIVEKHVTRPETTTNYGGIAGAVGTEASYTVGEYMEPHAKQLSSPNVPAAARIGAADPREGDYSLKSNTAYTNNRSANAPTAGGDNYFSAVSTGSAIGAMIAPLLDILRPNRREDTQNNLRAYENPRGPIPNSYIYNPADQPAPTIRQTTENSRNLNLVNRNQEGGAYLVTPQQVADTYRAFQTTSYVGGAAAVDSRATRNYDAEYGQRNNNLKPSTLTSYTPAGNMGLFNSDTNLSTIRNDSFQKNNRSLAPTYGPSLTVGAAEYGMLSGTTERLSSTIELDRNTSDVMGQVLRQNPYTTSYMNVA